MYGIFYAFATLLFEEIPNIDKIMHRINIGILRNTFILIGIVIIMIFKIKYNINLIVYLSYFIIMVLNIIYNIIDFLKY